jgi:hypothetical protein
VLYLDEGPEWYPRFRDADHGETTMSATIRRVDCYDATIKDAPGEGYRVLSLLESEGVNLLAFNAVPMGGDETRLMLFAEASDQLEHVAERAGLDLGDHQRAFLVQGDDHLGALAAIHKRVYDAEVSVFASWGVTDGHGRYGYVMWVRPERYEQAAFALGV